MAAGALAVLPVGLAAAGPTLFHPDVLLVGAVVAVLSSVLPYSLELVALRQVTPRAFGVLLSMDPAVAAIAGVVVLGQHLTARELVGLAPGERWPTSGTPWPAGPAWSPPRPDDPSQPRASTALQIGRRSRRPGSMVAPGAAPRPRSAAPGRRPPGADGLGPRSARYRPGR